MFLKNKLNLEFGAPALWELGTAEKTGGYSQIVCNAKGRPKKPLLIRKKSKSGCHKHALIPIAIGDYYICTVYDKYIPKYYMEIYRIVEINLKEEFYIAEEITNVPEELNAAIEAAKRKTQIKNCHEPLYVL